MHPLLNKDCNGPPAKVNWKYRSVIGMCGYLQGTSCPDIAMVTYQCARFCSSPKLSHERVSRGLLDTYWIPETRESFFALTYPRDWNALQMLLLLADGRTETMILLNLYCLGLVMLFCLQVVQLLGAASYKLRYFKYVPLRASTQPYPQP